MPAQITLTTNGRRSGLPDLSYFMGTRMGIPILVLEKVK
jgi:hypothetical protein